ncbi:MAG: hypothetical protein RL038_746 [Actinomycetota bacterium]
MLITEQFWWFLTRSSALISWFLLSVTVIWGILLSTRVFRSFDNPAWLRELHKFISTLGYVFAGIHLFSLYMDTWIQFSITDFLIPFQSQYVRSDVASLGNMPTALGVISIYLMTIIIVTSWLMRRIPRKLWKFIHMQSYLLILAVSLHAGWTGSDTKSNIYTYFSIALITLTTAAIFIRIFMPKSAVSLSNTVEQRPHFSPEMLDIKIARKRQLTSNIMEFQLTSEKKLPSWEPGSHISIALPNGLTRQYSLCGDPADDFYTISVLRTPDSKGGSKYLFEKAREGQDLQISPPRNHFKLETAHSYYFIAGGIGITPIKAMLESIPAHRPWQLLYLGTSLAELAYAQELVAMYGEKVQIHLSTDASNHFDFNNLPVNEFELFYVCASPVVVSVISKFIPEPQLRFEKFIGDTFDTAGDTKFEIDCTKSGKTVTVRSDESALEALEQANVKVYASCRTGTCGACELKLVDGVPEHRDSLGTSADDDVFYPCVSRAKSNKLTLEV